MVATLALSPNDITTKLVYNYLDSINVSLQESSAEVLFSRIHQILFKIINKYFLIQNSTLTLEDGKILTGTTSVVNGLTETFITGLAAKNETNAAEVRYLYDSFKFIK